MNDDAREWMPMTLHPVMYDLVEVMLADGSMLNASWIGNRWWIPHGSVEPVAWRVRDSLSSPAVCLRGSG